MLPSMFRKMETPRHPLGMGKRTIPIRIELLLGVV